MRKLILLLFLVPGLLLQATVVNEKLYRKAEAHFENREWNDALSMYNLLLTESPKEVGLYVSSVVAASYLKAPQSVMHYIELSEVNGVPLEALFAGVDSLTKAHRKSYMYEDMLLLMKKEQPWLKKLINTSLLKFYNFRNDASNIVTISDELLRIMPGNIDLLKARGNALLSENRGAEAVGCYNQVLEIDSTDWDANIFLGVYFYEKGTEALNSLTASYDSLTSPSRMQYAAYRRDRNRILNDDLKKASVYLEKADNEKTTPYIRKTLYSIYVQLSEAEKADKITKKKAGNKA